MKEKTHHLIPTFHHDIAYLRPESWYTETAARILDQAVAILQENRDYTFTVEQAYFFDAYWKTHPEKQELLKTLTEQGQLHFAPGFFSVPDMSMLSGESLFQQAYYGKKILAETVGYVPKTAYIADCWGHCAALPQILTQCGYTGYTFSRCMEKSLDTENFRWKGIDGTELNTHWMSTAYAGISFPDGEKVNAEELHWENATAAGIRSLMQRNAVCCGDDSQILPVGGDMRMPSAAAPAIVRELNASGSLPPMRFSSFEEAFDDIDFAEKPVYAGEFVSALKASFATNIQIKLANRRLEHLLYALEVLSVLQNRDADFSSPWKTVLKNQFHDILCGTICDESLVQVMDEYREAENELEQIRQQIAGGQGKVFNTLNFPVDGIRSRGTDTVAYHAEGFSAAEEKTLTGERIELPCIYENEFYRAEVDARGFITVLTEKKSGRTLVDHPSVSFGSIQMQADNGDNWVEFEYPWEEDHVHYSVNVPDPYDRHGLPTHPNVQLAANGVGTAEAVSFGEEGLQIIQKGQLRYWISDVPFTTTVTFAKNTPRISYRTEFTNHTKHIRLRAAFPVLHSEIIRHQIPYGIAERGEGVQPVQRFMDVSSGKGYGVALLNNGLPQNNCENGILMVTLFRSAAMEYKCPSSLSFNEGKSYSVEYAVVPHDAGSDDLLWENALHFNTPLVETGDDIPSGWNVKGAYISAMRKIDGDVFLRLYTGTGESKTAKIRVPERYRMYALTDGMMEPTEWKPVSGELLLDMKPYQVLGVRFSVR